MKQFNMGSQVINWDSEIFNNKKVVTPPRFWFLNDLVYIHLCDLTWATPRIFCWQDDRRSRSDLSSQGQVDSVQCKLSIISFMHWLSQSSRISSLTQTSRFSAADELSQSNTRDSNDTKVQNHVITTSAIFMIRIVVEILQNSCSYEMTSADGLWHDPTLLQNANSHLLWITNTHT